VIFQVLSTVITKFIVFWGVTLCSPADWYQYFRKKYAGFSSGWKRPDFPRLMTIKITVFWAVSPVSLDSSVGVATGYGLDGLSWVPGRGKAFLSIL
jgi:hypothetical protein